MHQVDYPQNNIKMIEVMQRFVLENQECLYQRHLSQKFNIHDFYYRMY